MIQIPSTVSRSWRTGVLAAVATASMLATGAGTAYAAPAPAGAAALEAARSTLAQRLVPHSSVGVDPKTNQVVLTIADAAKNTTGLVTAARQLGSAVRVEHIPGRFDTAAKIRGGKGVTDANGSGITCSLGFNITGGKMLTAGHCTQIVGSWNKELSGEFIGPSIDSQFPVNDFGLIRNDGGFRQPGEVSLWDAGNQDITGAADPYASEFVCKSGRTTHVTCGVVTETNVSVRYPQGQVDELIETTACAQPGDSGGPLFDAETALGLTSGIRNLPCGDPNFRSFFQPVVEALNFYGESVY